MRNRNVFTLMTIAVLSLAAAFRSDYGAHAESAKSPTELAGPPTPMLVTDFAPANVVAGGATAQSNATWFRPTPSFTGALSNGGQIAVLGTMTQPNISQDAAAIWEKMVRIQRPDWRECNDIYEQHTAA